MLNLPSPELVSCPRCHEPNPVIDERCAHCGGPLAVYIGPSRRMPRRIGLGSLMLVIALIAVCLVGWREAPPLGIALLLFVLPALGRTVWWITRRENAGRPFSGIEKVGAFAVSLMHVGLIFIMTLIGGAIGGLFLGMPVMGVIVIVLALIWVVPPIDIDVFIPFICGIIGAVVSFVLMVRSLWPIRE